MEPNDALPEDFWRHVVKGPQCWGWTGPISNGRPVFMHHGRYRPVIRLICAGLPENRNALKTCNNPCCINPAHHSYRKQGKPIILGPDNGPIAWRHPSSLTSLEKSLIVLEPKKRGYVGRLIARYGISAEAIRKLRQHES